MFGAFIGKALSRQSDENTLQSVFEKSVFVNVFALCVAATLLVLRPFCALSFSSPLSVGLTLLPFVLAKGSEEVVKLTKNKFLSLALPNSDIRATTLSLVSVAQNAFGFAAIFLSGLVAFMVTVGDRQAVVIFVACALLGIVGWFIYRKISSRPELIEHSNSG